MIRYVVRIFPTLAITWPHRHGGIDKPPAEATQVNGDVGFNVARPNEKLPIAHQADIE